VTEVFAPHAGVTWHVDSGDMGVMVLGEKGYLWQRTRVRRSFRVYTVICVPEVISLCYCLQCPTASSINYALFLNPQRSYSSLWCVLWHMDFMKFDSMVHVPYSSTLKAPIPLCDVSYDTWTLWSLVLWFIRILALVTRLLKGKNV
jgi:hypothetical protein